MTTPVDPRAEYRRRLQRRQTTIISSILAVMVVLTVVGLAVWTTMLPLPDPGFSEDDPQALLNPEPCVAADAVSVDLTQVPINVYNGTDTGGLAGTVAASLEAANLHVENIADWPNGHFEGDVIVTAGVAGIDAAYTLAQAFTTPAVVQYDPTRDIDDTTVSVVLGFDYHQTIKPPAQIMEIPADEPLAAPEDCVMPTPLAHDPNATPEGESEESTEGDSADGTAD